MFQKLVREHPTIQDYWEELLEKGFIENSEGSIQLLRKEELSERVLLVRDEASAISYSIRSGKLTVTRGLDTASPQAQTFHVDQVGSLKPEVLERAFEECEGFESCIRDLYKTLDKIIKEHKKKRPWYERTWEWLNNKTNLAFLVLFIGYAALTFAVWMTYFH